MQTFVPYGSDFAGNAASLDNKRLGKQRVEALQLLNTYRPDHDKKGWLNHPARLMWRHYEGSLVLYTLAMCDEWTARGFDDSIKAQVLDLADKYGWHSPRLPIWMDDQNVLDSHKGNLYRKLPEHYGQWAGVTWTACHSRCDYWWPVKQHLDKR